MAREEEHVVAALVSLCKELGVTCVAQIGAEDGYEANEIRKATGARAIAIDGDPKCKPCAPEIEWYERLIGATDSYVTFYVHKTGGLSSLFMRGDSAEEARQLGQERLDTFIAARGLPKPDALIIDTEGSTLDVLEGCSSLLDGVRVIYAEVQSVEIRPGMRLLPEVEAFLAARGFTLRPGLPAYDGGAQGNYTWTK